MAFTYITQLGGAAYNIDWAVGVTGSNGQADLMLVQSLFNILYFDHGGDPGEGKDPLLPPAGADALAVDGKYGPLTQRYIDHFQDTLRATGTWQMAPDRRMDPFKGASLSPHQKEVFSMTLLVRYCHFGDLSVGDHAYRDLPIEMGTPHVLRSALKHKKALPAQYTYHAPKPKKPVFYP